MEWTKYLMRVRCGYLSSSAGDVLLQCASSLATARPQCAACGWKCKQTGGARRGKKRNKEGIEPMSPGVDGFVEGVGIVQKGPERTGSRWSFRTVIVSSF